LITHHNLFDGPEWARVKRLFFNGIFLRSPLLPHFFHSLLALDTLSFTICLL
jgi:hypothetical protein